jgi:predicted ribosomally synthesized peptide with SipW-like signal peptide
MKKILGLTIAALLVMGLVGAGTWAYFSDPEAVSGNALTAGTLDLDIDGQDDTASALFSVGDVYPGGTGSGTAELENSGSITGNLSVELSVITNNESTGTTEYEADGAPGELGANAEIFIYIDVDQSGDFSSGDISLISDETAERYRQLHH